MQPQEAGLRSQELNDEIVVLDARVQLVHRISGETAESVRAEDDEVSRRRMIRTVIAAGVAAGATTLVLPHAAAKASSDGGGGSETIGETYIPLLREIV